MDYVSLYYPYLEPPDEWTKQALLFSDSISTIVPGYGWNSSATLEWLKGEGLWRGTMVRSLHRESARYRSEIEDALLEFADIPRYGREYAWRDPGQGMTLLRVGKLESEVEEALKALGLGRMNHRHEGMLVHEDVAGIILSITAKYLAAESVDMKARLIPSTDQRSAARYANAPFERHQEREECYELLLAGVTPIPGPLVSLMDVVAFRRGHADELLRLRIELNRLVENVRGSEDPIDAIRSARQEIGAAMSDVRAASRSHGIRLLAGSVSILGLAVAMRHVTLDNSLAVTFDGYGPVAIAAIAGLMRRRAPVHSEYSYLVRAAETFDGARIRRRRSSLSPSRRDDDDEDSL